MVFEYMDHDLTGLADRPGMRFSVPQIKVSGTTNDMLLNKLLFDGDMFNINAYSIFDFPFPIFCVVVLYETTIDRASLLSCKSSASSRY